MDHALLADHLPYTNEFIFFEARPGVAMILLPDTPAYTIVAVSNDFVTTSGMKRTEVIGKSHFAVFPENPADPSPSGIHTLRNSFEFILQYKQPHSLPLVRYDIPDGAGGFLERYWKSTNAPVLNDKGEVACIIHTSEDVTDQVQAKQAEVAHHQLLRAYQKIEESEQKYRSLFEAIDQGFCLVELIYDAQGKPIDHLFLETNSMYEAQTGLRDVHGKTAREVMPGIEAHWFEMYDKALRTRKTVRFMEESKALSRWFDVFVYPSGDAASKRVAVLFADVIERKQAEEALRSVKEEVEHQKRLYETITANTPDLIYVFDLNYRFTYANEALLTMWGKSRDEAIGKGLLENGYEPWHAEMHHREIDQVVATKQPIRGEVSFPHATLGRRIYDYIFVPVINANGTVEAVAGTTRDISEIKKAQEAVKQSERNIRSMILQAPVAMCILLGPEHVVDIANETMIQLWGKPKEQVLNKPIFEALPDARNQGLEEVMDKVYETGIPFYANERPVNLLRNGRLETVYQNFVYQSYKDAEGIILGVLAISIDVTDQVLARQKIEGIVVQRTRELEAANQALVRSNEELRRLNANLGDFAYAASHDLKEPIRKIHFFSNQLKSQLEEKLNSDQKQFFDRMENAAKRMATLVDDLLAYSQTTRGIAEQEVVDLNKKVQLVLGDLELEVQQRNARISVDHLPTIQGSKRQIQQLFQNLITNALKYSKPNTPPEVRITSREVRGKEVRPDLPSDKTETLYHLIEVRDNGIGFDQRDAERIFNMFTRLHGNAEYRGTGVGLSIVKKVVENHDGYIWATSKPQEGATFLVLLPAE